MRRYKTIAQTLLFLSILNLAFAAHIPRELNAQADETTPLQFSSLSSDGLPAHDSTSTTRAPTSTSALSAESGPAPVPGSNTNAPASLPRSSTAEGPTTGHYTAVTPNIVSKDTKTNFYNHPAVKGAAKRVAFAVVATTIFMGFTKGIHKLFYENDDN